MELEIYFEDLFFDQNLKICQVEEGKMKLLGLEVKVVLVLILI